jgi:hypothetical protein
MPGLSLNVPHALDLAEAMRRLRERCASIKAAYQANVTDLQETWSDDCVICRFCALGQKFQGSLKAEPGQVRVQMDLPLVAMMFRGAIENKVREELGKLLA